MSEKNKQREEDKSCVGKKPSVWMVIVGMLLVITAIVMYVTHRAVPFMMDDLWYSTNLSTGEPLADFGDVVESQIWHYQNWGGRVMTHGMLQLILMAGEQVADILNMVMFFGLAYVVCKMAGIRGKIAIGYGLFVASVLLLGLNANWRMSMFWQSGAANYLYSTPFFLLYLYIYFRQMLEAGENDSIIVQSFSSIGMMLLGVFVGWSNENMGPTAWILSLIVIALIRKEQHKLPLWSIFGSVASFWGSVMVIMAPGNFVRSGQSEEQGKGIFWKMFLRGYSESKALLEYLFPAMLVLLMMLVVAKVLKIAIGRENYLLMLGALLSWGAMVLSPHYPDRATFGTMVLLICVIISIGKRIYDERKDLLLPLTGSVVLIWLSGMFYLGEYMAILWGWIR